MDQLWALSYLPGLPRNRDYLILSLPFQEMQVDVKEILDKETLPKKVYRHLETSNLPLFQWTAIDVLTRIRFLSFSYRKDWFCGKAYLRLIIWWIRSFGFYYPLHIQSDGGVEFAASAPGSFKRNLEKVFKLLGVTGRAFLRYPYISSCHCEERRLI